MSAKPNVKQETRLISREYTWRSNMSFVRQRKKYRAEWSKHVCVLALMPFCFGELKRVLWARENNDSQHLTFISCCKKSASVLRNLLPNSHYLGPVLEVGSVGFWSKCDCKSLLHFLFFNSRHSLALDLPLFFFPFLERWEAKHSSCASQSALYS